MPSKLEVRLYLKTLFFEKTWQSVKKEIHVLNSLRASLPFPYNVNFSSAYEDIKSKYDVNISDTYSGQCLFGLSLKPENYFEATTDQMIAVRFKEAKKHNELPYRIVETTYSNALQAVKKELGINA